MRRFSFSLEKLLRLRQHHEREWELQLAEANGNCVKLNREIEDRTIKQARAFFRKTSGQGDLLTRLWAVELYTNRLTNESKELQNKLIEAELLRNEVKETYLEVSKKRKVLDKLKERRMNEYNAQIKRAEQMELDDRNNAVYSQKQEI
jgi:flagellar protein FliJ